MVQDARLIAPGGEFVGREAILGFLGAFQEAFPDGKLQNERVLVDGSSVAVEGTFTGTHDGILHTPDGDVPATGKAIRFRWAPVFETEGDQLTSEHLFFDQMDFLGQLGLLPE